MGKTYRKIDKKFKRKLKQDRKSRQDQRRVHIEKEKRNNDS